MQQKAKGWQGRCPNPRLKWQNQPGGRGTREASQACSPKAQDSASTMRHQKEKLYRPALLYRLVGHPQSKTGPQRNSSHPCGLAAHNSSHRIQLRLDSQVHHPPLYKDKPAVHAYKRPSKDSPGQEAPEAARTRRGTSKW